MFLFPQISKMIKLLLKRSNSIFCNPCSMQGFFKEITKSMEQSPLKANSSSASQELPRILWNTKFHYTLHHISSLVPILNQISTVQALDPIF
jgi:hypothetical protein